VPNVVNEQPFATTAHIGLWIVLSLCGCQSIQGNKHDVIIVDPSTTDGGSGTLELARQSNEQGIHFVMKEKLEKAKFKFEEAISIAPDYGPAYNNLGLVFFHMHDFHEAARAFEAASEKWPDSPEPLNNLGLVMDTVARPYYAMELYQQAHERAPTNAEFLGNLLRTRVQLGLIDDELRSQLHTLLLIEKRIEWQDWAREQLALLNNPELDRGPAKPSSDPLSELTERKQDGDLFYKPKSGSTSIPNSESNKSRTSEPTEIPHRIPSPIPEELPSLEPLRLPSPVVPPPSAAPLNVPPAGGPPSMFPTSLPSSTRRNPSILEVLE
jgi:hypothetical protein